MDILFIRHGETDWNRAHLIQGSTATTELNADGLRQAELTRDGLLAAGWRFDRVFSSPYRRAVQTAEILAAPYGLTPVTDARIREFNFGPYEGTSIRDFIDDNIRAAFKNPTAYVPRGTGESFEAVESRVRDFLESVVKPLEGQAESVLVVAHGGTLRTLTRIFDRRPLDEFWSRGSQPNCCAHRLRCADGDITLAERGLLFRETP